ncbi:MULTISPECIES: lipoprotein-releasing ABC transporter ATP-binding protein LolD [Marinobacterium]|jgi:lipoprotein-releasing system ATP-binding protein|uniref:Lipoprotein-releasing system ATP-binding protein LolD n=1 Tax=Marinobacterium iners DSM 11526 TaxID=1122198 RepID=A0A1H4B745_9GAMM|nr:lipoprotein-releasing ABC transporter ATP-binding protein LolD [Marinobacterium iners]QSR35085.1 lipoprotein-releasing system ATP-binding protein LolD [Marinobacterium iners]SEA43940.1 lipoprotein-releasing system ATP-binding protein [Marinobacterium iners DSM 11526]
MSEPVLSCRNINKRYEEAGNTVEVLHDISLTVAVGERVAIVGSSGSGKSTLLNILGGLDTPDSGEVEVAGQALYSISETQRCRLRNQSLGFVYQFHHLLHEFTALENVAMPLLIGDMNSKQAIERAEQSLVRVGLGHRLAHKPAQLSGGERQRVAIARALVMEPACVLMDEPTGNLDRHTAADVQHYLDELNQTLDTAFVIVTHDMQLAERMGRVYELVDGRFDA